MFLLNRRRIAVGLLLLLLISAPWLLSTYLTHIAVFIFINAIAVIGLGVLGGYAGQVSLGQAAFYGIGAYTSALLSTRLGLPVGLSILAAPLVAGAIGYIAGRPTMRVAGLYLVMITIGINEITRLILLNWIDFTHGPQGVKGIPGPMLGDISLRNSTWYFYLALGVLILVILLTHRILRSRVGMYLQALGDSEIAARMIGVDTAGVKTLAFVISAILAGLAGALYAHYIGYIHPDNFKLDVSVLFLTMAIFGGQRSIPGMLVAAAVLTGATEYLRSIGEYRLVAYGFLLLVGMIYMPDGIVPYFIDFFRRRWRKGLSAAAIEAGD
jgi:branched-chain amino acid transport system permease protein